MLKNGRLPSRHRGMTLHAYIINPSGKVVWIGGGIVIRLMTGETLGRYIGIVARNMALVTIIDGVTKGQRKAGVTINSRCPSRHRGVTIHANIVNPRRKVVGIGGGIVIRLMAGETLGRHIGIVCRIMTLIAVGNGMTNGQWEINMFKFSRLPSWHGGVTFHANIVNPRRKVIGIGGGIVIGLMAGETLGRHLGIVGRIMTLIAVGNGMTKGE